MQLNPMHLKMSALLTGRLFRIPEYQRAYAWGPRQRSDLFRDILDAKRSGREHFMATIVALSRDACIIGADEFRTVEVVDGQQRVTTIVILLKAIEKAFNQEGQRQDKVGRELSELLVKDDKHSLVLLQTNHDSSSLFTDYIRYGTINTDQVTTAADMNVVNAAQECEAFVRDWTADKPLIELVVTIRTLLSVIYHEISDEATVYRVFEVLNSRGLDVKWIDKLKSQLMALIFEHVNVGTRTEALKEMQETWKDIYRVLGLRGDLGDEALRFTGTWSLTARPNRILGQEDAAAELTRAAGIQVASIAAVARKLKAVVRAVHDLDMDNRLRAVTKISHARFVATAIILRKFEASVQTKLLGRWERVTFRIFGLGGADTRNKIGDYVRLGYRVFAGAITPEEIDEGLIALGKNYSIDECIVGKDYWSNCYDGWGEELRYILFRYEERLAESAGEHFNVGQWNKIWSDEPARSIEHIQPQSSNVEYVHYLGNLTMLPPKVNSSLQDRPPTEKAGTYRSCGLMATRIVGQVLEDGVVWGEAAVSDRTARIEAFIRKEWAD